MESKLVMILGLITMACFASTMAKSDLDTPLLSIAQHLLSGELVNISYTFESIYNTDNEI
jgi:hypothetical protein